MTRIINVNAVSIDGYIALKQFESDEDRLSYGLSSEADQSHVKELLKDSTAVITGSTSLISAGSTWQIENNQGNLVAWFVFTNRGLPESLQFWEEKTPRTLVTSRIGGITQKQHDFAVSRGVAVFYYENDAPKELYEHLSKIGHGQVLLFGGGQINQLFFAANLVRGIELTVCPVILGSSQASPYLMPELSHPTKLKLVTSQARGDHVFLSYRIED